MRRALCHLQRLGVAVAWRAALERVGDVHIFAARQVERGEHAVEQLAGLAHERLTLAVFFLAGRFADDHQVCGLIAAAKHRAVARFA